MKIKKLLLLSLAVLLVYGVVPVGTVNADSDDYYGRERGEGYERERGEGYERERSRSYKKRKGKKQRFLPPVDNALYADECASCHFLYLPGLLPSGSWVKIMEGAEDHFGEDLALDKETSTEILKYLKANGAETTRAKRSVKIMKSLKGKTPLRITEVRYIVKEHREVRKGVFERESIGSFSNCGACHRTADKGIFEEHDIKIPKR